jgi:uncharacterized protein (TIGR02145 family)
MKKNMFKVALWGAMVIAATLAACSEDDANNEDAVGITDGIGVEDGEGNTYRTKVYNGVEWMIDNSQKTAGVTGCTYDPIDRTKVEELDFGYLYSWSCAATACPEGWSLPTDEDFTALRSTLATDSVAWIDWNSGSSLAGYGSNGSYSDNQDLRGYWWSSSMSHRLWYVRSGSTSGTFNTNNSSFSFSVRCRKSR